MQKKSAIALDISKSSKLRILKDHLKLTAYKKQPWQLISVVFKKKRLANNVFTYYDEKIFIV